MSKHYFDVGQKIRAVVDSPVGWYQAGDVATVKAVFNQCDVPNCDKCSLGVWLRGTAFAVIAKNWEPV